MFDRILAEDVQEALKLGLIALPGEDLMDEHLSLTGGDQSVSPEEQEGRWTAWAEGRFSEEDQVLLKHDKDLILTMQETEVSPEVAQQCREELAFAKKSGRIK